MSISRHKIEELGRSCGFELVGVASAEPSADYGRFESWRARGYAGEMGYLTDRRGDVRADPRNLLPSARSIICVGKLYNTPAATPLATESADARGSISRYAHGADYHDVLRSGLERFVAAIGRELGALPFEARVCVDTAPLLERSYARAAGLGWIGKNTCLINQQAGSWFFLGEILLSVPLTPDLPAPDRCGSCTRCIEACPTDAIVPDGEGGWMLDARLCISYLTIEKRGAIPRDLSARMSNHLFGCDICQDVCPWNSRAPVASAPEFASAVAATSLSHYAGLTGDQFRSMFRRSPVWRAKYSGFLRNVAIAMGNSGQPEMREPLERLREHPIPSVASAARDALDTLSRS